MFTIVILGFVLACLIGAPVALPAVRLYRVLADARRFTSVPVAPVATTSHPSADGRYSI